MDPRHNLKAKLALGKEIRVEARRQHEREKFETLLCALRLGGLREDSCFAHLHLIKEHVDHGFPLPQKIVDLLTTATSVSLRAVGTDGTVAALLEIAVMGLKPNRKRFAYDLIDAYEKTGNWTPSQSYWAQRCLEEARNSARKVS